MGETFGGTQNVKDEETGFSVTFRKGEKKYTHYGPIVYEDGKILRVYGDKFKNINFWADYEVETGELNHYGMFTDDGSIETVYDAKNRLISTEIWVDGAYWGYFDGEWIYSAEGNYDDARPSETLPDEEVLKLITLSPREAEFGVSAVKSDDVGTPVAIGGSGDRISTVATMDAYNKSTYQMNVEGGELSKEIKLLLPCSAGQDRTIAEQFTYTVEHTLADGTVDTYQTERTDASQLKAEFTDKGILISGITSFSPFTVTWGPEQVDTVSTDGVGSLPSTGDASNLLAFACVLAASACALLVMNKRRVHQ